MAPAYAAGLPDGLKPAGAGTVREVVDGDTVVLDDGRQIRLVGTQGPKLPLGRRNFAEWPLASDAKRALEALALGRHVTLHTGGNGRDRHGRTLAHLLRDDGLWIQGEMLRLGWARMYTFPDNRAAVPEMRMAEQSARDAGVGIWSHPFYAARIPESVAKDTDSFQIVVGRVARASRTRDRTYLNFGMDYREDFTVEIPAEAMKRFTAAGLDPLTLKDARIEVRGWVAQRNGPAMEATHPEQISILER